MIRRFVALLMVSTLMAAQVSALVCPAAHHRAEVAHSSHSSHDAPTQSSQDRTPPDHCMTVTSCGPLTLLTPLGQGIHPATSYIAPFALAIGHYSAPLLAQITPPPRSA